MKRYILALTAVTFLAISFTRPSTGFAQVEVPDSEPVEVPSSPRKAWEDLPGQSQRPRNDYSVWQEVLLYIPNRVLDFIDIFRVDVGAGPTYGGVVRLTDQGQMGHREVDPFSVRVGLFGRQVPVLVEKTSEYGFIGDYKSSQERAVCQGEFGLGLDLLIGGYVGVCFDEFLDFAAGLVTYDPKGDDY